MGPVKDQLSQWTVQFLAAGGAVEGGVVFRLLAFFCWFEVEVPQPQERAAFGLVILNPASERLSE